MNWNFRLLTFLHIYDILMIPTTTLLGAYRAGFFPMSVSGELKWYSPDQRGIVPIDTFHVPRRLDRVLKHHRFEVSVDRVFQQVVVACGSRPDPAGNWIDDEIVETYAALHEAGHAHSVETWHHGTLVGGLYGVTLRGAFFGESMFHTMSDASKVALVELVERLRRCGYILLDIQWLTSHLARFGAIEVPRVRYLELLAEAMQVDCEFS